MLIIVVVLSMVLTPLLNEAGRWAAEIIDQNTEVEDVRSNFYSWPSYRPRIASDIDGYSFDSITIVLPRSKT